MYTYLYVSMHVLWHGLIVIPWLPREPTPPRFPVWLGIPKPLIPYPLLWEGAVRTVGSHLGRIPNCSRVPDPPPPWGTAPPQRPSHSPPTRGLRPIVSWRGGGELASKTEGSPPPPRAGPPP